MHRRYIAIDFGDRRTGVATGDSETRIATPLTVIEKPPEQGLIAALARLIRDDRPHAVVIGLPLNMDGTEGPQARKVRALGERLRTALGEVGDGSAPPELVFHDERLTTAQADWDLAQSGLTHKQKKQRRDAIAAAALLREWMGREDGRQSDCQ
ncbi:MAG: Holliday junction resolvase RuvX [Phycisphaerales bacterium]